MEIEDQVARLHRFVAWLDQFGETSWDHQSYFASDRMRRIKAAYYRRPVAGVALVAPVIACEAFLPRTRRLFWKPQRFPIADAHYAMGFAYLAQALGSSAYHDRAVHFLNVLIETRCKNAFRYCWGYPFHWETKNGTIPAETPLITTIPYVYEAFRAVYEIDGNPRWRTVMHSIAEHAAEDYHDRETAPGSFSCSYTPDPGDPCGVINASAYRAFVLTQASAEFAEPRYQRIAAGNLAYVIDSQNADGSWFYATDGKRDFVDHFHTCFVLKALAKVELLAPTAPVTAAIDRGLRYYVEHLFDADGSPKPFSRRPRLTVYRKELYDYAECINLGTLLAGRDRAFDQIVEKVIALAGWQKTDGSFRTRQLFWGWDDVPMHRWAQSQIFRSLSYALLRRIGTDAPKASRCGTETSAEG
ncbi:MAG: hypothetical protein IPM24_21925 [Bryobacterales bacterium]|nr:hypothetical protein [Bryobacterales bacterium]